MNRRSTWILIAIVLSIAQLCMAHDFIAEVTPLTDVRYDAISSDQVQYLNEKDWDRASKAGFSFRAIATIKVSFVPNRGEFNEGLQSANPFFKKLMDTAASYGANVITQANGTGGGTVAKNTEAVLSETATAYRLELRLPDSEPWPYDWSSGTNFSNAVSARIKSVVDEKKKTRIQETKEKMESTEYFKARKQALSDSLHEAMFKEFGLSPSTPAYVGASTGTYEVEISSLTAEQRKKLSAVTGRMVTSGSLIDLIDKNFDAFWRLGRRYRIPRLLKLKNDFPADYADFKAAFSVVYGLPPEEDGTPKPTRKSKQNGSAAKH